MKRIACTLTVLLLLLTHGTALALCPAKGCRAGVHKRAQTVVTPAPADLAPGTVLWERTDGTVEALTYACRIREDGWYFCELPPASAIAEGGAE